MATAIEWTDATWNPLVGCSMCSPGCAHCYAETMSKRIAAMARKDISIGKDPGRKRHYLDVINDKGKWNGKIALIEEALSEPLKRRKPTVWFVNSMSDLFHEGVPFEFVDKVFAAMALTPHHTYQVLTKRPERMAEYTISRNGMGNASLCDAINAIPAELGNRHGALSMPLANVWLGTSVENQKCADERIPHLHHCRAAVKFLSVEPLVEAVDLHDAFYRARNGPTDPYKRRLTMVIDWVIVGGESGPGARPFNPEWARSIIGQCKAAGVACFVKQLGSRPEISPGVFLSPKDKKGGDMSEWSEDLRVRQMPERKL